MSPGQSLESITPMFQQPLARLVSVACLVGLSACKPPDNRPEPVRAVKLIQIQTSDVHAGVEFAGEVRARVESRLGFRVGGKLVQRPVEVGQRVAAGQLLALIDAQDYQLAAQAAQAQVSAAQSQRDLAAADFKRFEALTAQNFISGAELERREAVLKSSEAALNQAKAQAQAQGNQAGYARLTASHAGVITAIEAEVGQVVSAGQPIVRLAHDGPRDAAFAVSEQLALGLKIGQSMTATLLSTGQPLKGKIRELAASADPVTRTYAVKLALEASANLPLGATVNVYSASMGSSQAEVIKLPTSALRQEGAGSAVWVLDEANMTVDLKPVHVATVDGNQVVISGGLQAGQKVVSAGVHVLTPGQKVTVYLDPAAKAAAPTPSGR